MNHQRSIEIANFLHGRTTTTYDDSEGWQYALRLIRRIFRSELQFVGSCADANGV